MKEIGEKFLNLFTPTALLIVTVIAMSVTLVFILYKNRQKIADFLRFNNNEGFAKIVRSVFIPFFWFFDQKIEKAKEELEKLKIDREEWTKQSKKGWPELNDETFDEDNIAFIRASLRKDRRKLETALEMQRESNEPKKFDPIIKETQKRIDDHHKKLQIMNEIFSNYVSGIDLAEAEAAVEIFEDKRNALFIIAPAWLLLLVSVLSICFSASLLAYLLPETLSRGVIFSSSFALLVAISFMLILIKAYRSVPEKQAYVIEFFGAYLTIWNSGPHFLFPFFMSISNRVYLADWPSPLYMDEEEHDGKKRKKVRFADSSASVFAELWTRVFNPKTATYGVPNSKESTDNKMEGGIRAYYGGKKIDEAIMQRADVDLRKIITQEATEAPIFKSWGQKIISLAITNIDPPEAIEKQRARILEAQKDLEVAEIQRQIQEIKVQTLEEEGKGMGKRLKAAVTATEDNNIGVADIIDYDKAVKKFTAYEKADILIAGADSSQSSALTGAVAGVAAQKGRSVKQETSGGEPSDSQQTA